MRYALAILIAVALLVSGSMTAAAAPHMAPLLAQADTPVFSPGHHGKGHGGPGMRKHLEQFRLLKLLEFLDLEDDQEIAFLTRFKDLRAAEDSLEAERKTHVQQLAELVTQETPDDAAIMALIDSVRAKMEARIEHFDGFVDDVKDILTPAQLGKLVIFHDRFEYELLERVRGFQNRRGPNQSPQDNR
ncbi:periplasmic heavy metal sensor [candidate division GN15 bacterium]|nr:periplasmic heavy metal sensor [candidate division GN15 bacterium]